MKVVVFTCDAYSWLVPTFLHFYEKNWPDNPYQTVFITETKKIEGATTFCTGKIPWTDGAINYLKSLNEKTFLFLLEDYILEKTVDTNRVKIAESICNNDVGCVRLNAHDSWSRFLFNTKIKGFKEYPLDKQYSVSLQAVIWQKEFLLEFLKKGENIWQVEIEGSKRVRTSKKRVIWIDVPAISYHPGGYMRKGKIAKPVKQWVEENW